MVQLKCKTEKCACWPASNSNSWLGQLLRQTRVYPGFHIMGVWPRIWGEHQPWFVKLFELIILMVYSGFAKCLTTTGTHMPCGITQCYLPPGRGDVPAITPAKAGTRFSDPGGMQGWVDLGGWLHIPRWTNLLTAKRYYAYIHWLF